MFKMMASCRTISVSCALAFSVFVSGMAESQAEDRGFLGMQVQGNSTKIAAALGLESAAGVLVLDISVDGPAAHAGISRGDLIVKMHGKAIDTFERLIQVAGTLKPGETVDVDLQRLGKKITVKMTLSPWPEGRDIEQSPFAAQPELGVTFASLTTKLRKNMGIRWASTGIVVTVFDDQFAGKTSLRRGDIVVQINQIPVWEPKQFLDAFNQAKQDNRESLLLLVERSDGFKYMLQSMPQAANDSLRAPVFKLPGQSGG